ncbi:hypothetical protein [Rhizobium oryzicola]|uniref:Transmembrane protein n=1 Tax=Rhizobium oryzicola TaxID=1232668 RepID=A0ABT8SSM6_9HYPH|nr:hypothetical protein [Rhizobium oryzicola]MDO1581424.1 hypothetical protein [Rhizobium oryzicola]
MTVKRRSRYWTWPRVAMIVALVLVVCSTIIAKMEHDVRWWHLALLAILGVNAVRLLNPHGTKR